MRFMVARFLVLAVVQAARMIIHDVHGPNGDYRVGVRWTGDITANTTFSFEARRTIQEEAVFVRYHQTVALVFYTCFFVN